MPDLRIAALCSVGFLAILAVTGRLHFILDEFQTPPRRVIALLLLTGVLTVAVFYPLTNAAHPQMIDPDEIRFPTLFAGHALLCGVLGAWWWLSGGPPLREFLALPGGDARSAVRLGLWAGGMGWVITITTMGVVALALGLSGHEAAAQPEAPPIMLWLAHLPVFKKLIIIAVAMTVEEAFFRAFLQTRLGLLLSSGLFAVAHFSYGLPLMVIAVLAISLVIGEVFRRTKNLVPCVVAHGVFDGIQLLLVLPVVTSMMK